MEHLLKTLPPERADPFPHLADLSAVEMLQRRVVIVGEVKSLEQERQAIDATLVEVFTDAELRFGVRAPGGWVLKQRTRTSWDYTPEIRDAIKGLQRQAQHDGRAQPLVSTYLAASQESV
ncbi:MAG: hypothetical protein WD200_02515 [Candidatus Andersenbacteria bacterium]